MSDRLKSCPFCGFNVFYVQDRPDHPERILIRCLNADCPLHREYIFTLEQWQSRPLEDALRAKLEMARNVLMYLHDPSGYFQPEVYDICERAIAEIDKIGEKNE